MGVVRAAGVAIPTQQLKKIVLLLSHQVRKFQLLTDVLQHQTSFSLLVGDGLSLS